MEHRDRILLQKVLSEQTRLTYTHIPWNIGELVKNLTEETRLKYPHIPWKAIAGFRDIAAHKYQTLHMEDVYETVITDFPLLKNHINEIQ